MWKRNAIAVLGITLVAGAAWAQRPGLPPGPMQEKARTACLACHDARIIVQQQLDRKAWTRNVDKMLRWGTVVAAEDREALIDYLAANFPPRAEAGAPPKLAEGTGVEEVRAACLGCHDASVIVERKLDRRGWTSVLDRQIRWGAKVRTEDREALLHYLQTHYGPAKETPAPQPASKPR